jgi:hypothetical protein
VEVAEIDLVVSADQAKPLAGDDLVMQVREHVCFVVEGTDVQRLHASPLGQRLRTYVI